MLKRLQRWFGGLLAQTGKTSADTIRPSTRSLNVLLYTRQGCHLCEEARALLEKYGLPVTLVDIDGDPMLAARYGSFIPVVSIEGKERFRGRVNELLLRRLLQTLA